MSITDRIEQEFVTAYKAKDAERVAVLRLLKTAIKNRQVELLRPLTEAEVLEVVGRQAKQRRESIEQFSAAGRMDLADKEERELTILKDYLPQALSPEELEAAVVKAIAETGASTPKDMGKVMKAVMEAHKGRVDGGTVQALVRSKLTG
jgi:uncharacterized protein YqeY